MFLNPCSRRRTASIVKKAAILLPQHSASGQEIQQLLGLIPNLGPRTALESTQAHPRTTLTIPSQPTARHGTRITAVISGMILHSLRQAKSALRLGYHPIFPPPVGHLQKNKISGTVLDVTFILSILNGTPLRIVSLQGLASLQANRISGRPCLTAFQVLR